MPFIRPRGGRFVPRRLPIQNIPNLARGLSDRQNPIEIPVNAMADCENVAVDENTIKSSPGWINMEVFPGNSPGPYYGIYQFYKAADGSSTILRMRKNILEYAPTAFFANVFTACTLPLTGSPASTFAFTDGNYPTFATLNDTVLVSNGVDSVLSSTDGITFVEETGLPKSKYIINDGKNRVIFAGQPGNPSRISWSDINDPTTISGFQLIEPNDGGIIRGVGRTPWGSLLVFKDEFVYEITNITYGFADVGIAARTKLADHKTIATTEDSVIFCGYDGPYEYIGGRVRYLFGEVKKKDRNFTLRNVGFVAAYFFRKYYLALPDANVSSLYNSQEYIIDRNLPGPSQNQPYAITRNRRYVGCYGIEDETGSIGPTLRAVSLYYGDSRISTGSPATGGTIYGYINSFELTSAEGYTQGLNGEAQDCYFTTKFFTNDEFYYEKKYRKFYFSAKSEETVNFTVSYRFDPYESFQSATVTSEGVTLEWEYDDGSTGGWAEGFDWAFTGISHNFVDVENSSDTPRGIQFKISWSTVEPVEIIDLSFNFRPKNKYR